MGATSGGVNPRSVSHWGLVRDVVGEKPPVVYLASPYSHPSAIVREVRFRDACKAAAYRMQTFGEIVFSPIAHSHPVEVCGELPPKDTAWWIQQDAPFMAMCDRLVVLQLDGYERSKGVQIEIEVFKAAGKPVSYMGPVA